MAVRKGEQVLTRVAMAVIGVLSITAILLQIFNEKTDVIETTYQIITFSVSITALTIAIMQGARNNKLTREINRISRETHIAIKEIKDLDQDNDQLKRQIAADMNIGKKTLELLQEENADLIQIIQNSNKTTQNKPKKNQ